MKPVNIRTSTHPASRSTTTPSVSANLGTTWCRYKNLQRKCSVLKVPLNAYFELVHFKKEFFTDIQVMSKDFSTFAGVLSGIAILSGLICFVLHLFNQNLYGSGHRHRFGNANLAPPILFSSDPGKWLIRFVLRWYKHCGHLPHLPTMISVICPPQMESLCRCVSVSSSNIFHMARLSQCRLLSLILLQETRFRLCPTPRKYFFFRLVAVTDPGASLTNVDTTHVQHVDATR